MHKLPVSGTLIAAAALVTAPVAAEESRPIPGVTAAPMTAADLITLPRLGPPAVNAAGTLAVYSVTITDPATLTRSPTHFLIDLAKPGASPVALQLGLRASGLTFAPDGQLYFLISEHPEGEGVELRGRVWRVTPAKDGSTGMPQLVAGYPDVDIAGFKLAPNGTAIALWAEVPRDCPTFGCPDAKPKHLLGPGTGRLYDAKDGFVRHWDRWATPGTPNRIFTFPLEGGVAQG
ncbi:MAG: S9 family peptidase, partial [Erythrobacter sp.]